MLVPIREFKWGEPSQLYKVTCSNHPTAEYLTKNPWSRGLHFCKAPEGFGPMQECPCPFDDLAVVVEE